MTKSKGLVLSLVVFLAGAENGFATTFLKFDSAYLGGGWFQYNLQMMNDPFFIEADVTGLALNFPAEVAYSTTSQNWDQTNWDGTYAYWAFTQRYPRRPYNEVFLMQSAQTSYRLETNIYEAGIVAFSLYPAAFIPESLFGVISANVVGIANLPCLVPCDPEDADGSPTNFSCTFKLLPDITINQLLMTKGAVEGVDFLWDYDSTLLLQASMDLTTWTNVAYIWSTNPETIWTTNQPLNGLGQYFSLELVADGYQSNLPPLTSIVSPAQPSVAKAAIGPSAAIPRVSGCQITNGQIAVLVATEANRNYTVSALDSHHAVRATQPLTATGNSATVYFDPQTLPTPVFFQVATESPD